MMHRCARSHHLTHESMKRMLALVAAGFGGTFEGRSGVDFGFGAGHIIQYCLALGAVSMAGNDFEPSVLRARPTMVNDPRVSLFDADHDFMEDLDHDSLIMDVDFAYAWLGLLADGPL